MSKKAKNLYFTILVMVLLIFTSHLSLCQIQNWTHFRGSELDGISSTIEAPVVWNDTLNIIWKTAIHDAGWSSPVVYDDQVWVTTANSDGKKMYAVCVDFESGEIIHDILVFEPDTLESKHSLNTWATPTPCIEEGFVYVHYGTYGTACINTDNSEIVWKRDDLNCQHVQGPGSSPVLYKDLLILHLEGIIVQDLYGLNKRTGEVIWKTSRDSKYFDHVDPINKKAYITPLIINVDGRDMMISNGATYCAAYDPNTSKEIWKVVFGDDSTIAMPVFANGLVIFNTGSVFPAEGNNFSKILAVDPRGEGDITGTNIKWELLNKELQLGTPVAWNGLMYLVNSANQAMCVDVNTGELIWSDRLKGKYNASPVYAAGNIYFPEVRGKVTAIKAGRELNILAENELEGQIWATPAVLRGAILLRTSEYLYRIGGER